MLKRALFLIGYFFSLQLYAFPCFITLVKDDCWTNYDLTVDVKNASTGKVVVSIIVPQGQSWTRQSFACQPKDRLSLEAAFTPIIWASDAGVKYAAKHDRILPDAITAGDTAWNINICYSDEFNNVPVPPESNGHCKCSLENIPAIPPQ